MASAISKTKVTSKSLKRTANTHPKSKANRNSSQPAAPATTKTRSVQKNGPETKSKLPRTQSQYTLDSLQGIRCSLCDKIPRFNQKRFGYLVNYADRLNVVLLIFAIAFALAAATTKTVGDDQKDYVVYFGYFSLVHIATVPFGLLFANYGRHCYLYVNMLANILVIGGIYGYLLYYNGIATSSEVIFASDKCIQTAIAVYQSTSIILMIIQLTYCSKMDLFRVRFQYKLFTGEEPEQKGNDAKTKAKTSQVSSVRNSAK